VLLLDEPTAALDAEAALAMRKVLADIAGDRTVVIATHSPQLLPVCRMVVELRCGRILFAQPSEQALPRLFGLTRPPSSPLPGGAGGEAAA